MAMESTFDPLEPLTVTLIDIRAAIEAQLRLLTAAQVCVEYRRENPTCDALGNCAAYLERVLQTNELLIPALIEAAGLARAVDVPS